MLKNFVVLVAVFLAAGLSVVAGAQTRSYQYDALGRLVRTDSSAGASSRVTYAYDAADNRTKVKQGVSAPSAQPDFAYLQCVYYSGGSYCDPGNIGALLNDLDSDLPNDSFTVTGISGPGSSWFGIASGGSDVIFGGPDGTFAINYTMKDADNQTSSSGITVVHVTFDCTGVEC